jgi:hypothetical protein
MVADYRDFVRLFCGADVSRSERQAWVDSHHIYVWLQDLVMSFNRFGAYPPRFYGIVDLSTFKDADAQTSAGENLSCVEILPGFGIASMTPRDWLEGWLQVWLDILHMCPELVKRV